MSDPDDGNSPPSPPLKLVSARPQPSGAQNRQAKKQRQREEAARERKRSGLNKQWRELQAKIGPPPMDPVGNSEWANNMAAAMALITAADKTIPMQERFKLTAEYLDRVVSSHSKALNAKEIRELQDKAGIKKRPTQADDARIVPVGAGGALRAKGRILPRH